MPSSVAHLVAIPADVRHNAPPHHSAGEWGGRLAATQLHDRRGRRARRCGPAAPGAAPTSHALQLRPAAADDQQGSLHQMGGREPRRESENPRCALGPLRVSARQQRFRECPQWARLSAHAARRIRAQARYLARLRARLPRYRLGRHDLGSAGGQPHDLDHRRATGRESARNRHRLRQSIGVSRQSHRQSLDDRNHQAAGGTHARHLRRPDPRAAIPSTSRSAPSTPTAITVGKRPRRSTRSSSPAASITFRRRCSANCGPTASW